MADEPMPLRAHRFLKALFFRKDYDHEDHMATLQAVKRAVVENKLARREVRRQLGPGIDIGAEIDDMTEPTVAPVTKNGKHG